MLNTKFICVAGPQGAGKTYLSKLLAAEFNKRFNLTTKVDAIAAPIYDFARLMTDDGDFRWDDDTAGRKAKAKEYVIYGDPRKGDDTSGKLLGRALLQDIGRAFRTIYHEGFWIEQLLARNVGKHEVVFVSDCRMPSEAAAGDCLIWIDTCQRLAQQRPDDDTEKHHELLRKSACALVTRHDARYMVRNQVLEEQGEAIHYLSEKIWAVINKSRGLGFYHNPYRKSTEDAVN